MSVNSNTSRQQGAGNRRRQQKQTQLHSRQSSTSEVSEGASLSAWDNGADRTRPITPGRRGDSQAQRPSSGGGRSRRAKERAEDNAGHALKAKRQLDRFISQLKDSSVENHPTEINLESCRVGDRGAVNLSYALRSNSTVQRLRLGGCDITYAGMRSLRDVLRDTRATVYGPALVNVIRRIELCTRKVPKVGNPLGNHGAECLAEVIRTSTSLRHVNASSCSIGDEGATSVADAVALSPSLVTLELDQNVIGNTGAASLGRALQRNKVLQGLSLWKNRVGARGAEGLGDGLIANSTLQWLGLGCNKIFDAGAGHLAKALCLGRGKSKLSWLAIGGNNITDDGAVFIARALQGKSLEELEASDEDDEGSTIDDAAATELPDLKSLGIGGNDLSDEAAEGFGNMLLENDVLLSLGMGDCNIGDDGARHLAVGLQGNDSLQRMVLSGNCISDEGAGYLASSLSQNSSLKSLYLAENPITDEGGHRFQEVLCGHYNNTLSTLDIHETDMSVKGFTELCNILRKNSNLQQLGTHLSVIDLASSSTNLGEAAGSTDAMDGAAASPTSDDEGRVLQTVRGNALLGQKKPKTGSSFRTGQGATQVGGLFRARGAATAAAIQAIPSVADDRTSAEVALEGFRTFVTDDEAAAALNAGDEDDERAHSAESTSNRFLNLRLPGRRSYVFSNRSSVTSPTGSEGGRKKRWSIFGSRKVSSSNLSGSQTELISLSEDQKQGGGDADYREYSVSKQTSQSSLPPPPPPPPAMDLHMPNADQESSLTTELPLPPVQLRHPEKHGQKAGAGPSPGEETAAVPSVRMIKSRESVIVDPNAALSGGWRRGKGASSGRSGSRRGSSNKHAGADWSTLPEDEDADDVQDPALLAWASQTPNEADDGPAPAPALALQPAKATDNRSHTEPDNSTPEPEVASSRRGSEQAVELPRKDSSRRRKSELDRVKDGSPKASRLSPLLSRISISRHSKRKRKMEAEEVTVEQILLESARAAGERPNALRVSTVSNASAVVNPYQDLELEYSPPMQQGPHESDDELEIPERILLDPGHDHYEMGRDASPLLKPIATSPPKPDVITEQQPDGSKPVEARGQSSRRSKKNSGKKSKKNVDMEALPQKLNAALVQRLEPPRIQPVKNPVVVDEVFVNDEDYQDNVGQDDTDLAIQHISRSASNLSHLTKTRSRPSGRRPPSRETSLTSVNIPTGRPISPGSPVSLDPISDDTDCLLPASKPTKAPTPLSTPLIQNETLLERLTMLQNGNPLQEDFSELQLTIEQMTYRHAIASSSKHVDKIRPNAALAPDESLATLLGIDRISDFTFINASYVGNMLDPRLCIATQAPLPETISDFWRLIWEHRVRQILSLTTESDGYTASYSSDVEQDFDLVEAKSHMASIGKMHPSALKVIHTPKRVHSIPNVTSQDYVVENSRTMETRSVHAYHYSAWSEEGLRGSTGDLAQLIGEMLARKSGEEPILIHCKDGGIRTGALAASIAAAHIMLSATKRRSQVSLHEGDVSLDSIWLKTAKQRPGFAHDQPTFRVYNQIVLGCVFGADALKNTDLASSRQTSKAALFGRKSTKKKSKKGKK